MKIFSSSPLIKALALSRPELSAGLFYGAMVVVGAWVSLLLFSTTAVDAMLRRMHLASGTFPAFAVQQISPAMYNCSNEGWQSVADVSLEQWNQIIPDHDHYYNHFPVRNLTWLERLNIDSTAGLWGYYISCFQGRELHTKYRLQPAPDGGWNVVRLESKFSDELH